MSVVQMTDVDISSASGHDLVAVDAVADVCASLNAGKLGLPAPSRRTTVGLPIFFSFLFYFYFVYFLLSFLFQCVGEFLILVF